MIFLGASGIIYGCFLLLKHRAHTELVKRHRLHFLTQQAFQAKMDPHFIFNSLNSLKYFIRSKQTDKASTYLDSFATLMRSHLEYAKEEYTYLNKELDLIKNYCELEQMRIDGQLSLRLEVDKALNSEEVKIPSMLLQPLVENAIWHGLRGVQDSKKLSILVTYQNNELRILIADNGKGLQGRKSSELIKPGHALFFIQKRLELFSEMTGKRHVFLVQDIGIDSKGFGCLIILPVETKDE